MDRATRKLLKELGPAGEASRHALLAAELGLKQQDNEKAPSHPTRGVGRSARPARKQPIALAKWAVRRRTYR